MNRPKLILRARRQTVITVEEYDEEIDEPSMEDEPFTVLQRRIDACAREHGITPAYAERVVFGLMKLRG